jgi:hypothetical protein
MEETSANREHSGTLQGMIAPKHPSRPYIKIITKVFLKQDLLKPGVGE